MNKRFIPGIYNYCDRWCERCPFNHRCRLFADEAKLTPEEKDINNEQFWQRLSQNFEKTVEMLHKMAEEMGVDISGADEDTEEAREALNRRQEKIAAGEPYQLKGADKSGDEDDLENWDHVQKSETKERCERIDRRTKRYSRQVDRFFDLNQDYFHGKQAELEQQIVMNLPVDEQGLHDLQNAFQSIRWYQFFVASKSHRALSGFEFEDEDDEAYWSDIQNDSNGSAKVAVMAIRRSMAAWETVRQHFSEKTDELLDIFVMLRKTENDLLAIFPRAMDFVRPGFDEPRRQPRKKHFDVEGATGFQPKN